MRVVLLIILLVGAVVSGGCADGRSRNAPPPVDEALAFSGVVVPPGGEVLGVDASQGIDSFYKVAVAVDAGAVDRLLADSQFRTPLEPGRDVTYEPLPQAPVGTDFASGSDELSPGPGRPNAVFRELLVDRSDPARPVVHVWAFTT
ncbi:hypothetical protein SAMN02982929_03179 [Saccharopolyspora kobensis]|uniref:Uncharacterized protein n=1 Tax=Saccharopolyspora kobensis TaxID=146035 RepID=A0A1H6C6Q7_9PSEU|nr:hypothetical protein [Saccharopolyspora kobensis]SEG68680.1 hypothetical protein SAMN02982929_03179 [Saccharopolyspora kobensis]SFC30666.1 hypothetical protein SAMN05216506_101420 [Saccharopolyspora kobensis]